MSLRDQASSSPPVPAEAGERAFAAAWDRLTGRVTPADVERVAKAIWEDDTTESWDGAPRGERAAYLSNARAALKALGLEVSGE